MSKKLSICFVVAACSVLVYGSSVSAQVDLCAGVQNKIRIVAQDMRATRVIANAFLAYGNYVTNGKHIMCFEKVGDGNVEITEPLQLTTNLAFGDDIQVVGLNVARNMNANLAGPLLTITNNGAGKVILQNAALTNVKDGLALKGSGPIDLINSKIEGDGAKLGSCLSIESPNGTVTGGEILNCGKGIVSSASDTTLEAVIIHDVNSCVELAGSSAKVKGGDISKCVDGIKLSGVDALIDSAIIHDASTCVNIGGDRGKVKASEISNCSDGVRIAASDTLLGADDTVIYEDEAARNKVYEAEKNKIHDNVTGIHVVSGDRNRFAFNDVDKNAEAGKNPTADNGIMMEASANGGIARPRVIFPQEGSKNALRCKADKDGNILERSIQFEVPSKGKIVLLVSGRFKQATGLFSICNVDVDGICKIEQIVSAVEIDSTQCGKEDVILTALFTGTGSSSYLIDPFNFIGIITTEIAPPEEMPINMPGVQGNSPDTGDIVALGDDKSEDDKVSSGTTSSAMSGDAGGALASPAMAMKCSLDPTNASPSMLDLAFTLIAFSLTISLITRLRLRLDN